MIFLNLQYRQVGESFKSLLILMEREVLTVKKTLVLLAELVYRVSKQMLSLKKILPQDLLTNLSRQMSHKYRIFFSRWSSCMVAGIGMKQM